MITRPWQVLINIETKLRMGPLYEGLNVFNKISLSYNFLQMLRRAGFVLLAFSPFYDVPATIQIMTCMYVGMYFNIFVAAVKPFYSEE